MKTKILKPSSLNNKTVKNLIKETFIKSGLVIFPTETVYGIGANALSPEAAKKIYKAKGRPSDNPLIVHIAAKQDVKKYVKSINQDAFHLINKFWPGPLTLIFNKNAVVPKETTGNLNTVAIRMPNNKVALQLIKIAGMPLAAPSANLSGKPSSTKFKHVYQDFHGRVDIIINGGSSKIGIESTVVDTTVKPFVILRPGSITKAMIEKTLNKKVLDNSDKKPVGKVKSPGMKYVHYKPNGQVIIIEGSTKKVAAYINAQSSNLVGKKVIVVTKKENAKYFNYKVVSFSLKNSQKEIAHNLFDTLRKMDDLGADIIFVQHIGSKNLAYPIMNRLIKAAAYKVIKV